MRNSALPVVLLFLAAVLPAGARLPYPSDPLSSALRQAGANRAELQRVLDHYAADPQKLDAARWLISHMPGKAYKVVRTVDRRGRDVGFDCLKYPNLDAALNAYDALEKERGALQDRATAHPDLRKLKAEFLIDHIDRAFHAWKTLPWAKQVEYGVFRDYVLPYRGGKEPAEAWRAELMDRYASLSSTMKDPADLREASGLITADLNRWVGFWDLYYMHPTEQGFSEMKQSRKGRCGDLSNLATMALRSNGIPCAIDYTPWWADAGNNHAWPVTLDRNGRGRDSVGKAAKVYRKTFANQPGNLLYDAARGEKLPPWLDRPDYVDVTDQYLPTTDVPVEVDARGARHAYLCVFNSGEWRPIQWARVVAGLAVFKGMGRDILYLPATWTARGLRPAGPPFILTAGGRVAPLGAERAAAVTVTVGGTARGEGDYRLSTGKAYTLHVWEGAWKPLGTRTAAGKPLQFSGVPAGGLYWLVEEGSRREERPFAVHGGALTWR